jgi:hypothetical protein
MEYAILGEKTEIESAGRNLSMLVCGVIMVKGPSGSPYLVRPTREM